MGENNFADYLCENDSIFSLAEEFCYKVYMNDIH